MGFIMVEKDTIKLLRECDSGVKMGVASINDVLKYVNSEALEKYLTDYKREHEKLNSEIQSLLEKYNDSGKSPGPIAKGMSWMASSMKLVMKESDSTIADLMTDGCNIGVRTMIKRLKTKPINLKVKSIGFVCFLINIAFVLILHTQFTNFEHHDSMYRQLIFLILDNNL